MSDETCQGCKFWQSRWEYLDYQDEDLPDLTDGIKLIYTEIGMCRRLPPVAVAHEDEITGFNSFDGDASDFFEFPVTRQGDWCGEFKAKTVGASIAVAIEKQA